MKTIGLLGGMSWESTVTYYTKINEGVKHTLGGLHSAKIAMYSIDFNAIEKLQHTGDWSATAVILAEAAINNQSAGADFSLICTNTMHKVADEIAENIDIPLLHIADATGEALVKNKTKKIGLLGTSFKMEQEFYKGRLKDNFELEVVIPNEKDRKTVHRIIYNELCLGKIAGSSKAELLQIVERLGSMGAEAVILGCTEIGILINHGDSEMALYDTNDIHVSSAEELAIQLNR